MVVQNPFQFLSTPIHCTKRGDGWLQLSRTSQGHEHFFNQAAVLANVFFDDGVPTGKAVLVPEPLVDLLGVLALLPGTLAIPFEDAVDDPGFTAALATAPSANLRPPG